MARPKNTSHRERRPGGVRTAWFYDATGRRVNKSLQTRDPALADRICKDLEALRDGRIPEGLHPIAAQLYFGDAAVFEGQGPGELESPQDERVAREEVRALRLQVVAQAERIRQLEAENDALRGSVVGRLIQARENCPPMATALQLFERRRHAQVKAKTAKNELSVVRRFLESLPDEVLKPTDIEARHVNHWLDGQSTGDKSLIRRDKMRNRVGRFVNFCAAEWCYESIMTAVDKSNVSRLRQERGEIVWHSEDRVEAMVTGLGGYYGAVVATLGYAGLRLSELVWLRVCDLIEDGDDWLLRITRVTTVDGTHKLKTANSRREVRVHSRLLRPRLEEHVATLPKGSTYLFPMPPNMRRRKRLDGRVSDQWRVNNLSRKLNGHTGGSNRQPTPGLLPDDVTCLTLRHTFGSLMLRAGRSYAEVAAAMGHDEATCREYYARLDGCEVDVDF